MIQATLKIVTTPVGEDNPEVHSQGLWLAKSLQAMGVGSVIKYGTGLLTTHEFHRPIGNSRIRVFQFLGSLSFVSFIRDS